MFASDEQHKHLKLILVVREAATLIASAMSACGLVVVKYAETA